MDGNTLLKEKGREILRIASSTAHVMFGFLDLCSRRSKSQWGWQKFFSCREYGCLGSCMPMKTRMCINCGQRDTSTGHYEMAPKDFSENGDRA